MILYQTNNVFCIFINKLYLLQIVKLYLQTHTVGIPTFTSGDPVLDFFYILFNGISEVPLFSSPVTGILILVGVLIASRKAGMMMVLAGLVGAGTAILLGADYGL